MRHPKKFKLPNAAEIELPLYNVFRSVKKLDAQTGHATVDTKSYFLLLETLQKGYMLLSADSLLFFCEKLWLKPCHYGSSILNKQVLQELLQQELQVMFEDTKTNQQDLPTALPSKKNTGTKRPVTSGKNNPVSAPGPREASETDKLISLQQGSLSIYVDDSTTIADNVNTSTAGRERQFMNKNFMVKGTYLPMNPRYIEQSVRLYRSRLKGQKKSAPNWPATAEDISKKGYFSELVLQQTNLYSSQFTVLIDYSESMAAFNLYSETIASVIARDNTNNYDEIYYFNNCPGDKLFFDRIQTGAVSIEKFAGEEKKNILLISDAGAARGNFNRDRVRSTLRILRKLQKHRIAWMNPMPRARWQNTSAAMIAGFADMFDIGEHSMDGLSNIVRLFKEKIRTGKS